MEMLLKKEIGTANVMASLNVFRVHSSWQHFWTLTSDLGHSLLASDVKRMDFNTLLSE